MMVTEPARPQAIPIATTPTQPAPIPSGKPAPNAPAPHVVKTAEHVADTSNGYRMAVGCTLGIVMAQWLDASTWLPLSLTHDAVHFVCSGIIVFCGASLGFLPRLTRRPAK